MANTIEETLMEPKFLFPVLLSIAAFLASIVHASYMSNGAARGLSQTKIRRYDSNRNNDSTQSSSSLMKISNRNLSNRAPADGTALLSVETHELNQCQIQAGCTNLGRQVDVDDEGLQQAVQDYMDDPTLSPYGDTINCWDMSQVTSMNKAFLSQYRFNADLNCWDTSAVTSMQNMLIRSNWTKCHCKIDRSHLRRRLVLEHFWA